MTDDPREILAEAGVECEELTEVLGLLDSTGLPRRGFPMGDIDDAFLALARLVVKYKRDAEKAMKEAYPLPGAWDE